MEALGYVECNGLSSATVAADRMLKTSDIKLSRIQNAENGWITLEFKGDIAALKVAVETVKQTLPENYIAGLVIGSPSKGLSKLGNSGATDVAPKNFNPEKYNSDGTMKKWATFGPDVSPQINTKDEDQLISNKLTKTEKNDEQKLANDDETEVENRVTCNLCGDPKCPRKSGEPHAKCIHYDKSSKK